MLDFNPYLHFMGNTEQAMKFYKRVFGGEFTIFARFRDVPGSEKMPEENLDKIIHISLHIGGGHTIMATDSLESMGQKLTNGNNFHICVQAESESEAERFFNELSESGEVEMPMNKTFFATYFGMCRDQFGIQWMINYMEKK